MTPQTLATLNAHDAWMIDDNPTGQPTRRCRVWRLNENLPLQPRLIAEATGETDQDASERAVGRMEVAA